MIIKLFHIVLLAGGLLACASCDSKPQAGASPASQPAAEHSSTAQSALPATGPAGMTTQPARQATLLPDGTHISFTELQRNIALNVVWEMYWHQGKSQKQIQAEAANPITVWRLEGNQQDPMVFFHLVELRWLMTLWPDKAGRYDIGFSRDYFPGETSRKQIDTFSVTLTPEIIQRVCKPATDFSLEMQHVRTILSKPDLLKFIGRYGTPKSSSTKVWVGPKVEGVSLVYYYIEGDEYIGEMYIEDGTHQLAHDDYFWMKQPAAYAKDLQTAMYRLKKAGKSEVIKLNLNRAAATQP